MYLKPLYKLTKAFRATSYRIAYCDYFISLEATLFFFHRTLKFDHIVTFTDIYILRVQRVIWKGIAVYNLMYVMDTISWSAELIKKKEQHKVK